MATVDRYEPVLRFITSLSNQNCNQAQIELIVIDQNSDGRLSTYLESLRYEFDILYVSTPIRGLSKARNIGLKMARGTFVGFPDDDCEYYPDTISQILAAFQNGQQDLVVGRIFDRQLGKTVLKNFPKKSKKLTLFNCHAVASSIVIFERKSDRPRLFNESMGAGEYFGSCEDLNYLFEGLRAGLTGTYLTQIEVWHPESDSNFIPLEKVGSYSRGFGYFVFHDDQISISKLFLLILLVFYKTFQLVGLGSRKKFRRGYFRAYYRGLLDGVLGGIKKTKL